MQKNIFKFLIHLSNTRLINHALVKFTNARVSRRLIPAYIRHYRVDTGEIKENPDNFQSLNAFFIRELRSGARPLDQQAERVISPVDCVVEVSATLTADAQFKVKGQTLTLRELLGDEDSAAEYAGGHIFVLYLSPADYHRIHAPFDCNLDSQYTLGKTSWPVNPDGLCYGPRPLCTNHRIVNLLSNGACAVFVGATNVNSIVCTSSNVWKKGAEVAYFQFGSTVVLLFKQGRLQPLVAAGSRMLMGEAIGEFPSTHIDP